MKLPCAALALLAWAGACPAQQSGPKVLKLLGEERVEIGRHVHSVAFSPDGKLLAVGEDSVHLFDLSGKAPQPVGVLNARVTFGIHSMAFSPDGKKLAFGGGDHSVRVWDVAAQTEVARVKEHTGAVRSVAFTPDGAVLASGSDDKTAMLWDVAEDGKLTERAVLKAQDQYAAGVRSVVFTGRGKTLVTGHSNGTFRTYSLAGAKPRQTALSKARHGFGEVSVASAPDGHAWAVTDHKTIHLLDPLGQETGVLVGRGNMEQVVFSPDSRMLASAGEDGRLLVWSVAAHAVRVSKDRPGRFSCVAFAPKGDEGSDMLVAGGMVEGSVFVLKVGYRAK